MGLRKFNKKGFTLIEIAIVLVIIGLLIGGVLKGQSMINNARVKRLVKDMEGLRTAVITYQDRFGMLPGDENDPNSPPGDVNNGDRDGLLDETNGWEIADLRLAQLIPGAGTALPTNNYGGTLAVDYVNVGGSGNLNQIVATRIPAEACLEIDTKYDDGVRTTGAIRAGTDYIANTIIDTFAWAL